MSARSQTPRTEPIRVPVRLCPCGALPGECECAELAVQMHTAPLVVIRRPR